MENEARITDIVQKFFAAKSLSEPFNVRRPTVEEDCYLVRFENPKLPDLEMPIPFDEPLERTLPPRLETLLVYLDM